MEPTPPKDELPAVLVLIPCVCTRPRSKLACSVGFMWNVCAPGRFMIRCLLARHPSVLRHSSKSSKLGSSLVEFHARLYNAQITSPYYLIRDNFNQTK